MRTRQSAQNYFPLIYIFPLTRQTAHPNMGMPPSGGGNERDKVDFNARDEYFRNRQKQAARAEIQEYITAGLLIASVIAMIVKVAVS